MNKYLKSFLLASVFLVVFALAACGGGSESEDTGTDDSEADVEDTDSNEGESSEGANADEIEERTFKISHVTQESHVWHKTAEKFGEELERLSDGKLTVDIFPASQLGLEKDMIQQLETGSLDIGFMTNAYMSTRQESLGAWFMPFVFDNLEEAVKMRESEAAKQMLEELSSQSLVGLDFIFAGNRHVLLKQDNVSEAADLKGKKIRIIGSPVMQDFWEAVEAGPTAMPLPEVYTSLQTGVIDGIDIDLDALVTEKYYENANHLTLTNHMTFPSVIVMGEPTYSALSDTEKAIVSEAMDLAVSWGIQEAIDRENANLESLKDEGVSVTELKDDPKLVEISEKIKEEYSGKSDTIKLFLEEAAK